MRRFEVARRVVLVTGASSGLGRAVSRAFARFGAWVALLARNKAALAEVKDSIVVAGGKAEIFPFDLQKMHAIPALISEVENRMGASVDVLVNAAGFAVGGLLEECLLMHYRRNFEVNFYAPLALIQAVLPAMKAQRQGQIINVTSGVGKRALPGVSSYSATKAALNAVTESLRLELARDGIDVISFSPGAMGTAFHERSEFFGRYRGSFPHLCVRSPEAVAEKLVRAARLRRREVILWGPGRFGLHMNYWAPRLLDWLIARSFKLGSAQS